LTAVVGLSGRSNQVQTLAARAAAAAGRAPETAAIQTNIAWTEVFVLGLAGQLEQAQETVDRLVATLSGKFAVAYQPTYDGWLALLKGRVRTAAALLREFRPYYPGHGGGWTAWLEVILAQAQAMAGDAVGAREALERAERWRHPGVTFIVPLFGLARAWLAAAEGTISTAVGQARQAATGNAGLPSSVSSALALVTQTEDIRDPAPVGASRELVVIHQVS
jgi:hypothetical protein